MTAPSLRLCVALSVSLATVAPAFNPSASTLTFLGNMETGRRGVLGPDRLSALCGTTLAVNSEELPVDEFVDEFLDENGAALGVADLQVLFKRTRNIRNDKFTIREYHQVICGVPQLDSYVKVLVLLSDPEKISYVGMQLSQPPASCASPVLSAQDALDEVSESANYDHLNTFDSTSIFEEGYFEAADQSLHHVWRFQGWDTDEHYEFTVDAMDGSLVYVRNLISHYDGEVSLKARVEPCCHPGRPDWPACCPNGNPVECCNCPDDDPNWPNCCCGFDLGAFHTGKNRVVPLPGILTATASLCPQGPSGDNVFVPAHLTDASGMFDYSACSDSNCSGGLVCGRLSGPSAIVYLGGEGEQTTEVATNCIDSTSQQFNDVLDLSACGVGSCHINCNYADLYASNAYYSVTAIHDWIKDLQPSFTEIDLALPVYVDFDESDATGNATRLILGAKGDDFGVTHTIIGHEYGHFASARLGWSLEDPTAIIDLGEQAADVFAMLMWDTPCRGYNTNGFDQACDNNADRPIDTLYPGLPFGGVDAGLGKKRVFPEAFWDLRQQLLYCEDDSSVSCSDHGDCDLGPCLNSQCSDHRSCQSDTDCKLGPCIDRLTEELFFDVLPLIGDGPSMPMVCALASVDDDDGDLSTTARSPHYEAIHHAFVEVHSFPDPFGGDEEGVEVDWLGPSGDPIPDTDYRVTYNFSPPIVELLTSEVDTVPVDRWHIGRTVNGKPADIGAVVASWGTHSQLIDVRVGSEEGFPCRNANLIRIDDSGAASSLRINVQGTLFSQAYCEADGGVGGRISGTVAGQANWIKGEAIGVGPDSAGELRTGALRMVDIQSLPANSLIATGTATEEITIASASDGDIRIEGDLSGKLTIGGNMSGDIIADWDADGEGVISGKVTINGDFTGAICDANMAVTGLLASNVTINGDDDAVICPARTPVKLKALPHSALKNRALTINPRSTNGHEVALRLTLTDMPRCSTTTSRACDSSGDCPSGESCQDHPDVETSWWVGAPFDPSCQEENGTPLPNNPECSGEFVIARVLNTAVYREWIEPIVHVADCEIVPVATYTIEATEDGTVFTEAESFQTVGKPGGGKQWGDVVGVNSGDGWTPPNGLTNVNDVVAVTTFISTGGSAASAHISWVDITGPSDGSPNALVNVSDTLAVVKAANADTFLGMMDNYDPGNCPETASPVMGQGDPISLTLSSGDEFLDPEEWLYVDVFTAAIDELGAYEVALEVSGGTSGNLVLADIIVDDERTDYVFGTDTAIIAKNVNQGRVGVVREGGGTEVVGTKYLATFVYQPESGASGVFDIALNYEGATFLNDGNGILLAVTLGSAEVVGVGIDCWETWHCNDNNACTTNACTNYECVFTNSTQGTSCNDGLFCTATDTCNGSGLCTGTGNPCPPRTHWCNEFQDQCEESEEGEEQ